MEENVREIILKALCDPENQPHQWMDDWKELEKDLFEKEDKQ